MSTQSVTPPLQPEIAEMVRRIAHGFKSQRVILFGTHARGSATSASDADLLIVAPATGSKRKFATPIDLALAGIPLPAGIIIVTPEEFERGKTQLGAIVRSAFLEGSVLHDRAG